jgi:hypothetical protein
LSDMVRMVRAHEARQADANFVWTKKHGPETPAADDQTVKQTHRWSEFAISANSDAEAATRVRDVGP